MGGSDDIEGALAGLDQALSRLERAQSAFADRIDTGQSATLAAVEAERDLVRKNHQRLVMETETALGDLDRLIATAGRS